MDIDLDNLVFLYNSGVSCDKIAKDLGLAHNTVYRRLREMGVVLKGVRLDIDVDTLIKLHESGIHVKQLAEMFGISRKTITNRFKKRGFVQRGHSEFMKERMKNTTPEERARLTSAAHAAARGRRCSDEELCKRAASKENDPRWISPVERKCIGLFQKSGLSVTPQKAVGPYNIDIALAEYPIAVEIFGGYWHSGGRHAARFRKRTDYIINAGWIPVIIWVSRDYPLDTGAVQYVITLTEKLCSGESISRQEHMIRGDGDISTIGYDHFHNRPVIPGPQPRDNPTGRFAKRVR